MREASISQTWRRLKDRKFDTYVDSISVRDLRGIASLVLNLGPGITALVGANGVGKSTILRALLAALDPQRASEPAVVRVVTGAHVECSFIVDNDRHNTALGVSSTAPRIPVQWIDAGRHAHALHAKLEEFGGVGDQLPSLEPRLAKADELEEMSYVVGRTYHEARTYEVDLGKEDDELHPYFVVKSLGSEYGVEDMGQGELSAHLLLWTVRRAPPRSVVLIEEPETFLSPRAQTALIDAIAHHADRKGLAVVFSTHSEAILRRIPIERIRLLLRSESGVRVELVNSRAACHLVLGVPFAPRNLLLVEDVVAKCFVQQAIVRFTKDLLPDVAVEVVEGGESVMRTLLRLNWRASSQRMIGILDGDQRASPPKDATCPTLFLPGDGSPEDSFRELARRNQSGLAAALGVAERSVELALSGLQGSDSHDWLTGFARGLAQPVETVVGAFLVLWDGDATHRAEFVDFVKALDGILRS